MDLSLILGARYKRLMYISTPWTISMNSFGSFIGSSWTNQDWLNWQIVYHKNYEIPFFGSSTIDWIIFHPNVQNQATSNRMKDCFKLTFTKSLFERFHTLVDQTNIASCIFLYMLNLEMFRFSIIKTLQKDFLAWSLVKYTWSWITFD